MQGIIRRIDDLGRVVIPKEIRKAMRIRENDPLEIILTNEGVFLKKFSEVAQISDIAKKYVSALHDATGHICLVTDCDTVISATGEGKKMFLSKPIWNWVEESLKIRKSILVDTPNVVEGVSLQYQAIAPIIVNGDAVGTVVIVSQLVDLGEKEMKLTETAAGFFASYLRD